MRGRKKQSRRSLPRIGAITAELLVAITTATHVLAADYLPLPVVKPVISCTGLAAEKLSREDLSRAVGAPVTIASATVIDTPKGHFCKVLGSVESPVGFEVDLPMEHWTQRFAQGPQGHITVRNAGSNAVAVNGEFVVATDDKGGPGIARVSVWTADNQQKRIDWAYRGNHVTALVSKALIKAFYGRKPKFSYYVGCSAGAKETLVEAQRYPDTFDGVVAGAPVVLDNEHNAFFHGLEAHVNKRADGSIVWPGNGASAARLAILHKAVLAHCAAVSGVIDNTLQNPYACHFDPSWVQCPAGSSDTSQCLTPEETAVAMRLYEGPADEADHHFDIAGYPLGSELFWKFSTAAGPADDASNPGRSLVRLLSPTDPAETDTAIDKQFTWSQEWFDKALVLGPLWNAGNTDLRHFAQRGGKLILWNGAEDLTLQPAVAIAYYQGLQKTLGAAQTDRFARLFLLPGVGHCGGAEGPDQVDVLSPLMAWVELHRAPAMLIAGKTREGHLGGGGQNVQDQPFTPAAKPTTFTRPIYPYPYVARYSGKGDPNDAASYVRAQLPDWHSPVFYPELTTLIGPDNQLDYRVEDGKLVGSKPATHAALN
jgi:hypothetical protein